MNDWLAGFVIGVVVALYFAWLRTAYQLRKVQRSAQRLVNHTRPTTQYDEYAVAGDFLRDLQFLVGDRVSGQGDE